MFHQLSFFEELFSQKIDLKKKKTVQDQVYFRDSVVEVQRRAYQRSLNLLVRPNGALKVTAGRTVPAKVIQNFLLKNSNWIQTHLHQFEELRRKYPPKEYVAGEPFLFCGEVLRLKFICGSDQPRKPQVERVKNELLVLSQESLEKAVVRKLVRQFYETEAKRILTNKVEEMSEVMQLFPLQIKFRSLKSQWGSCSSKGVIQLNWRLITFPEKLWTYVIVHELAHLRHANHSANFWQLVESYFPDYKLSRKYLADHHYEVDFLALKSELYLEEL